jgi:HEPN domain-containing protein
MTKQIKNREKITLNQQRLNEVIKEQMDHIFFHRPNENILRLADDLLECSKQDLKVCQLLYQEKKYAYSTYFLQQCAEKASKAYVLYFGKFTKNDLYTISHNSLKAFVMLLERMDSLVSKIHSLYPYINTDTKDLKELVQNPKKRLEMAKVSYQEKFSIGFKIFSLSFRASLESFKIY